MTSVDILPDAELVAIDWLRGQVEVVALADDRVSNTSPSAGVGGGAYLTVERIGGVPAVRRRLDRARLQVGAWASSRAEASTLARTARAALHRMEGHTGAGATVGAVRDDLGLAWLPDTVRTPPTPRYVFSVTVALHA